jgi:hypothetical protein
MKPVGHLQGRGRACAGALGVGFGAVAGNDLHARVRPQPRGQPLGGALVEQVDGPVGLQVDEQRRVAVAPAQREVVDAQHAGRGTRRDVGLAEQPQQRIGAGRQARRRRQPGPGLATSAQGEAGEGGGDLGRAPRVPRQAAPERLGEGRSPAPRVGAAEAPDRQRQPHLPPPPG